MAEFSEVFANVLPSNNYTDWRIQLTSLYVTLHVITLKAYQKGIK